MMDGLVYAYLGSPKTSPGETFHQTQNSLQKVPDRTMAGDGLQGNSPPEESVLADLCLNNGPAVPGGRAASDEVHLL